MNKKYTTCDTPTPLPTVPFFVYLWRKLSVAVLCFDPRRTEFLEQNSLAPTNLSILLSFSLAISILVRNPNRDVIKPVWYAAESYQAYIFTHLLGSKPEPILTRFLVDLMWLPTFKWVVYWRTGHLFSFSIQPEHCEIKNEDSKKITIKACGEAKILVNGEPVDDDEEEELHHLDRCFF